MLNLSTILTVDRIISRVSIVKLRGEHILHRHVLLHGLDGGEVTENSVILWETRMKVSIPSVQLKVCPVAMSDMFCLGDLPVFENIG